MKRARSYTAATTNVLECCSSFPARSAPIFSPRKGEKSHCSGCIRAKLCVLSASCVISQITFDTQMTAGMDTDVLIIPANVIAALKEQNLHVRCFLYELATKRFSDVMWAMQQIMFKGLDRRLAEFLLAEAERTGSDTIRMTHEQIAQHRQARPAGLLRRLVRTVQNARSRAPRDR